MKRRTRAVTATGALLVGLTVAPVTSVPAEAQAQAEYTVLAADAASPGAAEAAIARAGGRIVGRTSGVRMYQVVAAGEGFVERTARSGALAGAAHRRPIGRAPYRKPVAVERARGGAAGAGADRSTAGLDPLDGRQWGLRMVRSDRARTVTSGDKRVSVGILDTGVDASNPDLAPNFDWKLSRNFARDMPVLDGACEVASCLDPVGTDDGGHGTHVAGIVGAAANGFGLSGVAPGVDLVELKGGQDSGYFFLESVVNALVYAGDTGIDVVNMSFYLDPWLYNCPGNAADSTAEQTEQRTIIAGMTRALTYAHARGVTLVAALGNNNEDLGKPRTDISSPDFPVGAEHNRPIDNASCLSLPVEGPFVLGVSAVGPSGRKADYSNYGTEQISFAAPGGYLSDGYGTASYRSNANEVLSTYPVKLLQDEGTVDSAGNITTAGRDLVVKRCTSGGKCAYYTYLQGTSMASPHVAGVAALVVSRYGKADPSHPGTLRLAPSTVESALARSATRQPCPSPRLQTYRREGRSAQYDAYCAGGKGFNGFYGAGIVDAYAAMTRGY
jgi:subtilisin family serine protease